ncbi:hypothetical protein Pmani_037884 [Petrolisthes manimaculis]|uniref:Uncharacterized protein n=1 Tax=Petrolisthes manimaculis TaxID=1843537 RepID=A0AAE1NGY6_9EUCA|nr:hypothetical protein Pmani_037884 [Petrolisthes manimaculis]
MQGMVFDIMGNYDAFPCIPPYLSPQIYKQTVENSIYLLEMMVLGSYTYWHYHNQQFRHRPSTNRGRSAANNSNRHMPGWGSARNNRVGGAHRLREDSISSTSTQSTIIECGGYREEDEVEATATTVSTVALATGVSGSIGNTTNHSNNNKDTSDHTSNNTRVSEATRSSKGYIKTPPGQHSSSKQDPPHQQHPFSQGDTLNQRDEYTDEIDGPRGLGRVSNQANMLLSFTEHQPANRSHTNITHQLITSHQETPQCHSSVNEHSTSSPNNQQHDTPHCSTPVRQHDTDERMASKINVLGQNDFLTNPERRSRVVHLHQPTTIPGNQRIHQPVILLHRPSDEEIDA